MSESSQLLIYPEDPSNPLDTDPTDPNNAIPEKHKPDSSVSVATAQRTLPKTHPNMMLRRRLDKAKEMPNGLNYIRKIASNISGDGTLNGGIPPVSQILGTAIGITQSKQLKEFQNTIGAINSLMHFTSMETASLRHFVQIIRSVPGITGINQLPYFKSLSESIGASMTILTDASALQDTSWINTAAKSLGITTPLSKLNRSKMFPPLVKNIDAAHNDLIRSLDLNLSKIYSEYMGFISGFGSILGLLPHEVTSLLGKITGIVSQVTGQIQGALGQIQSITNQAQDIYNSLSSGAGPAAGFTNSILSAYSKLVTTSHGLDMLVDIAHMQRLADQQSQMLNKLTTKFGDQLRMVDSIKPIAGYVQIQPSIFQSNIHGYSATVNILGDKIIYEKFTDDVLKAIS